MDIAKLIALHFSGLISEAEEKELQAWLEEDSENMQFFRSLASDSSFKERYLQQSKIDVESAIHHFDRHTRRDQKRGKLWICTTAAAVVFFLLCSAWYLRVYQKSNSIPSQVAEQIVPGDSKAILKLADDKVVYLSKEDVQIDELKNVQIDHEKGELIYSGLQGQEGEYNELILPKGGEYMLKLSDGTTVRLNSGSRLKYPVVFDGNNRNVELEGEAFFDVASDSLHPFCVKVQDIVVKAYGTAFNINTHTADHIRTVLVRGRIGIKIENLGEEYMIRPSQLADFDGNTKQVVVRDADVSPYIAWTRGYFVFINETLEQMLNTLGLWYDFEVEFVDPSARQLHFSGSMKRYGEITKILDAISYTVGVSIRQHGKKIIVERR